MWKYLSNLGIKNTDSSLEAHSKKLGNQINIGVFIIMLFLFLFLRVMGIIEHGSIGISSVRVLLTMLLSVVNLVLAYYNKNTLAIIFLIFFIPITFLVFPTLMGFVEAESFTYYPFVIIAASIIPQLLLLPERNKYLYWGAILFYFSLFLGIDYLLKLFIPEPFPIVGEIENFILYYKLAQLLIFVFINISVYYLRQINQKFDEELMEVNTCLEIYSKDLLQKNKELEMYKQELSTQNDELKNALQVIKNTQQKLFQSEKMAALGILIAGVAHEINNPMNYIAGGATLLESDLEDFINTIPLNKNQSDIQDFKLKIDSSLNMIHSGVQKSATIISSLRNYSSENIGRGEYLDIHKVIESAIDFLGKKSSDIQLIRNYSLNTTLFINKDKMHQVFLNIIDNALFALKSEDVPEKKINIRTHQEQNFAVISILNNGPRIPENVSNRIYDPFFTTKGPSEGTGLGLAITYNVIKEHKGFIDLINNDSEVGFIIKLNLNGEFSGKESIYYDL